MYYFFCALFLPASCSVIGQPECECVCFVCLAKRFSGDTVSERCIEHNQSNTMIINRVLQVVMNGIRHTVHCTMYSTLYSPKVAEGQHWIVIRAGCASTVATNTKSVYICHSSTFAYIASTQLAVFFLLAFSSQRFWFPIRVY